jgi:hypothetical protein
LKIIKLKWKIALRIKQISLWLGHIKNIQSKWIKHLFRLLVLVLMLLSFRNPNSVHSTFTSINFRLPWVVWTPSPLRNLNLIKHLNFYNFTSFFFWKLRFCESMFKHEEVLFKFASMFLSCFYNKSIEIWKIGD